MTAEGKVPNEDAIVKPSVQVQNPQTVNHENVGALQTIVFTLIHALLPTARNYCESQKHTCTGFRTPARRSVRITAAWQFVPGDDLVRSWASKVMPLFSKISC